MRTCTFVVRTIQTILDDVEEELEEVAWCVGTSLWITFWHILFPPLTPLLLTKIILGFSREILGKYGSIVLISFNIPMKDLVIFCTYFS